MKISQYRNGSSLSVEFLREQHPRVLVETGTHAGGTVQNALDAGVEEITSIEFGHDIYERAVDRFKNEPRVKMVFGDSRIALWDVIKEYNEPILFFLDAHYSGNEGEPCEGIPEHEIVIKELEQIRSHPVRGHTIFIDNIHNFCGPRAEIYEILFRICAGYVITISSSMGFVFARPFEA